MYLFFCLFDLKKNEILFYNICAIYNDQTAEFSPPNRGLLRESYPTGLNSGYIRIYTKNAQYWGIHCFWPVEAVIYLAATSSLWTPRPRRTSAVIRPANEVLETPWGTSEVKWATWGMEKKPPPGLFRVEIRDYIYYPLIVGDYFIDHERRISSLNNQDSTCI